MNDPIAKCRVLNCNNSTFSVHNEFCHECSSARRERRYVGARKAVATRRERFPNWAIPQHADKTWKGMAHRYVAVAKEMGYLPKLDGSVACVDCGAPALEYDHRDYSRPLDVDPVCKSCNRRRGTAVWPQPRIFGTAPASSEAAA